MQIVGEPPSASGGGDTSSGSLSLSTRDLVVRLYFEERLSFPEIARRLGVTRAWVYAIAADEQLRRGKSSEGEGGDADGSSAPRGCLVCGTIPTPPARLRANGLCTRHAYRLEKYGDPEAELPSDRPSVCESCGVQCGKRGAGAKRAGETQDGDGDSTIVRSGRIIGADGVYRCQRCAWREDKGFRARHRESARKWKVRARGLRILRDTEEAMFEKWQDGQISHEEYDDICEVIDAAKSRLQERGGKQT